MATKKGKDGKGSWGDGSISQNADGTWTAQIYIDRKRKRKVAATFEAAQVELERFRELKRRKVDVTSGEQTVASWMNAYHHEKREKDGSKQRTVEFNAELIERYIIPWLGELKMLDVRPSHLQDALDDIYRGIRDGGRYEGARTVHAIASVLKEAFNLAAERKIVLDDPYTGIRLPKYRKKKIVPLELSEIRDFLKAASGELDTRLPYTAKDGKTKRYPPIDDRLYLLWLCYIVLGLRRGEGIGLRWECINWEEGVIVIDQQLQRVSDDDGVHLISNTPKTADGERKLPMTKRIKKMFDALMTSRLQVAKDALHALDAIGLSDEAVEQALRHHGRAEGYIFLSNNGKPLWPDNLEHRFRLIRDAAGLPKTFKLHHFRHGAATMLAEEDAADHLISGILGHAHKNVTQLYTHSRIAAMRRALQKVEDLIFEE